MYISIYLCIYIYISIYMYFLLTCWRWLLSEARLLSIPRLGRLLSIARLGSLRVSRISSIALLRRLLWVTTRDYKKWPINNKTQRLSMLTLESRSALRRRITTSRRVSTRRWVTTRRWVATRRRVSTRRRWVPTWSRRVSLWNCKRDVQINNN